MISETDDRNNAPCPICDGIRPDRYKELEAAKNEMTLAEIKAALLQLEKERNPVSVKYSVHVKFGPPGKHASEPNTITFYAKCSVCGYVWQTQKDF
jgi:hypothetical protein